VRRNGEQRCDGDDRHHHAQSRWAAAPLPLLDGANWGRIHDVRPYARGADENKSEFR
jgi:hypothetical protein